MADIMSHNKTHVLQVKEKVNSLYDQVKGEVGPRQYHEVLQDRGNQKLTSCQGGEALKWYWTWWISLNIKFDECFFLNVLTSSLVAVKETSEKIQEPHYCISCYCQILILMSLVYILTARYKIYI